MKRAAHFERNDPLGAALLAALAGAPDGIGIAGDHRLVGGVDVRGDVGGILAEGMADRGDDAVDLVANHGEDRGAVRENGGLGVLGRGQLLFRALEHDAGQRDAPPERRVDRVEHRARRRKPFRQIFSHADFLGALTGAEPDRAYHRTTMLPQVKPAPNAQSITTMPGFSRPVLTASSSAIAMAAAAVLPKRSTFT